MTLDEAKLLAKALRLLNDKPRFGPRDRTLKFDSYSVAAEIDAYLKANGWNPHHSQLIT